MAVHWHSVDAYNLTKADRQAIKDSFAADRDKLTAIIDEAAWTNAKRDAAHKDAAQVARRLLKAVKALVL
ncbi:MAG: hypothetical protein IPI51_07215 [Betaproteobacteria bacterium]|nr:hypothetical protein [Betaproteobacteria bacterium]